MDEKSKSFRKWNWVHLLILFVVIGILGFLGTIAAPIFRWTGESKQNYIIDNLRFIDGAKNEWAIEHGITNDEQVLQLTNQPTEQDLAPYVKLIQGRLAVPIAGEIYMINPLNVSTGAKLTRKVGTWPKGSIIRLRGNAHPGEELILPDQTN
jgi:hypothetical protein